MEKGSNTQGIKCPTFSGLSYFFLLLGKFPTFSHFFRFLFKLINKNVILKQTFFFVSLPSAYFPSVSNFPL